MSHLASLPPMLVVNPVGYHDLFVVADELAHVVPPLVDLKTPHTVAVPGAIRLPPSKVVPCGLGTGDFESTGYAARISARIAVPTPILVRRPIGVDYKEAK